MSEEDLDDIAGQLDTHGNTRDRRGSKRSLIAPRQLINNGSLKLILSKRNRKPRPITLPKIDGGAK